MAREGRKWVQTVCQPYAPSPPRPCPAHAAGQGGGRARRAHILVSAVRAPSCVGRLPLRLLSERPLQAREAPAGGERGEREGVVRRGKTWLGLGLGLGARVRVRVRADPRFEKS